MKTELQTIHEFLADDYAMAGSDQYAYAELLVLRAIRQKQSSISNHFFHNQIKRRIAMITQKKLHRYNYLGKVMALPVLFIIFCAFTLNVSRHSGSKILRSLLLHDTLSPEEIAKLDLKKMIDLKEVQTITVNNEVVVAKLNSGDSLVMRRKDFKAYADQASPKTAPDAAKVFTQAEKMPGYPGGAPAWMKYLNENFKYPKEALDKEIEGTVLIQFLVDQDGNISDVQAIKGPETGGLKEEGVRIIKNSGKWVPAQQFGVTVKAYKIQPITFKLHE